MPIEVFCPSPTCARVHQVKNKYAGLRGKCPACGAWMLVPATGQMPSAVGLPSQPPPTILLPEAPRETPQPLRDEGNQSPQTGAAPATSRKQFRWAGAFLILLGLLSLGCIAATPFLDAGQVVVEGDFPEDFATNKLEGIKEEYRPGVLAAPAVAAVVALLALTAGLAGKRFGFFSLFFLYVAALLSAGLLFVVLHAFHEEVAQKDQFDRAVTHLETAGVQGDAVYRLGTYLFAGLAGAVGAAVCFTLAVVVLHRRWWSRLFAVLFLGGAAALGAVWIYRDLLGIGPIQDVLSS